MKPALTRYIICPECKRDLIFTPCREEGIDGILDCCGAGHCYPVFHGVPVLIANTCLEKFLNPAEVGALRRACHLLKKGFRFSGAAGGNDPLRKSYLNWSLQWNEYSFADSVWENDTTFFEHIPLDRNALAAHGTVLEIGSGQGRNIKHVRAGDNLVFAVDISESAYIAGKRYEKDENVFVVRCDAMHLPFRDDFFSLIISDHVLQHISGLEDCFGEIKRVARHGHEFFFNLYSKENNLLLTHAIEPFKRIVLNHLPVRLVDLLANIPAALLWLLIQGIYRPLRNMPVYKFLPLAQHMTFWFGFGYDMLKVTCFDLLQAPIANYFGAKDVLRLGETTGFYFEKKYLLRQTLWVCSGTFQKAVSGNTQTAFYQCLSRCPLCTKELIAKETFSFNGYQVITCSECLARFCHPFVDNREIYTSDFISKNKEYFQARQFEIAVHPSLREFVEVRDKKVLDVGCGTGNFLDALKGGNDVLGIEISGAFRPFLDRKGIPCKVGEPDAVLAELDDSDFDLITLWDVFEHLKDPGAVLKIIKQKLSGNGVLIIWTNNYDDFITKFSEMIYRITFGKISWFMEKSFHRSGGHNFNFAAKSLDDLFRRNGLRVVKTIVTDTPAERFTSSGLFLIALRTFYFLNRMFGKGKIICYVVKK